MTRSKKKQEPAADILAQAAGEQKSAAQKAAEKAPVTQEDLDKQAQIKELEKQAASEKAERAKRVYKNAVELDHDLFKLEPATMMKNISFTEEPHYVRLEHCHIFHTINSAGKKQVVSSHTGGHFHEVEVIKEGTDIEPPVLKVGPPLKHAWQRYRRTKRTKKITVPFDDADKHGHAVTYLRSEKIRPRKLNAEFVKFQSAVDAKQNPRMPEIIK